MPPLQTLKKFIGDKLRGFFDFFTGLAQNRKVIFALAASDLRSRNLGSVLGFFWVFLNPLLSMLVIWGVFEFGIKGNAGEKNSISWIIGGLVAWQLISEGISSGAASIIEKPYLVKKIKFDTEILPVIKVVNTLKLSLFFILFFVFIAFTHGTLAVTSLVQLPYYLFSLAFLLLAIGILLSCLVVFYKDFQNIIGFILQLGFWGTPILWNPAILDNYHMGWVLKYHPLHYLVQGIRDSVFGGSMFYSHPESAFIFWVEAIVLFIFARLIFKKLQPSLADVI